MASEEDDIILEESEEVVGNEEENDEEDNDEENEEYTITNGTKSSKRAPRNYNPNRFPLTRIRTIMKMDPDLTIASQDSVYLLAKATELFVQYQATESYKVTKQAKRKTVQKKDLDVTINELDSMAFLEGAVD